MTNVIEIVKASITAYNDKNWSKAKDVLAADVVSAALHITAAIGGRLDSSAEG
jgi:hypothetical protein